MGIAGPIIFVVLIALVVFGLAASWTGSPSNGPSQSSDDYEVKTKQVHDWDSDGNYIGYTRQVRVPKKEAPKSG